MKNLIFAGALIIGISGALAQPAQASAVRLLQAMPACKDFAEVKRVNEADKLADGAMSQSESALVNIKTFDQTCGQTAADSSYNSEAQINKMMSESKIATKTAVTAMNTLEAAIKQVKPVANSLAAVGTRKDCVKEASALPEKLAAEQAKLKSAMKNLESCVNRPSVSTVTGMSTSTVTSTSSGISGKNPADHSDTPSSCMPGDGDCADRNPFAQ